MLHVSSGLIPNDTIERESRKFQKEHGESKGDSSLSNVPWIDRESNAMTERTSSAQSVATTGKEKPNQSVEKVPSQDGCAVIDNGSFSVLNSSKSSMSQDAGLSQMSPQKGGAVKQSLCKSQNVSMYSNLLWLNQLAARCFKIKYHCC